MILYDKDTERYVLMLMIFKPELIPNIANEVGASDFFFDINREIFLIIQKLIKNQPRVDVATIYNEYKKEPAYIMSLTDDYQYVSAQNWKQYAETVRKFSMARGLVEVSKELEDITDKNVEEKIGSMTTGINKIAENRGGSDIRSIREVSGGTIERIEKAIDLNGKMSGYDWGLESLNKITDGIQKELIILGARASVGKTAGALKVMKDLAKRNIRCGYFSLEMTGEALNMRMLSDLTSIPMNKLRGGTLTAEQKDRICKCGIEMLSYPIYIVDKMRGEWPKIEARIRYMVRVLGVKVVFIDHISLIKYPDRSLKRYEQFSEISNGLQALQRELDIPIIALAQLGRESEGQMPTIADLRESGSFEQDADMVILMHRQRITDASITQVPTSWYVAKNRNGACGVARTMFYPQYSRFTDEE